MLAILKPLKCSGLSMAHTNNWSQVGRVSIKLLIVSFLVFAGLLAVLLAFFSARTQAANNNRVADVNQIQAALKIYFDENGFYPAGNGTPTRFEEYLDFWPTPPKPAGSCGQGTDTYNYTQRSLGSDYSLTFCLSSSSSGLRSGNYTLTSRGLQN